MIQVTYNFQCDRCKKLFAQEGFEYPRHMPYLHLRYPTTVHSAFGMELCAACRPAVEQAVRAELELEVTG